MIGIPQKCTVRCLRRRRLVPGPSSKGVRPHFFFRNLSSNSTPPVLPPSTEVVETDTALPLLPLLPPPPPEPSPEEVKAALAAAKLEAAQIAIGYRFKQPALLWEALQAAGSSVTLPEGNKQLAVVGDKLLGFHLALIGRERGEDTKEMTYRISTQAGNQHLHDVCDAAGLTPCIHHSASEKSKFMIGPKTKTATVEAVIAAVHFDSGMEAALAVIRHLKI
ncbi:hypothetical protein SLS62_005068 [Diatrype stigma]|uniref:RNase III domain-containing protein n=1 Tax=Diatrype stigma TaxID=117547 RepID=A0AAN9V1R3_9PEZI